MGKRSNKLSHAAHVKSNTKGTSNELSFSVLDAARTKLDEGKKGKPTEQARRFGRISLFTLPIGRKKPPSTPMKDQIQAITGSLSHPILPRAKKLSLPVEDKVESSHKPQEERLPQSDARKEAPASVTPASVGFEATSPRSGRTSKEEIAWRKGRRRRRRIAAGMLSAVIIVGISGLGIAWLYNDNLRYQEDVSQINQARESLAATDELLLRLDEALQDPMENAAAALLDADTEKEAAFQALDQAQSEASGASSSLRESTERSVADNLMTAASARRTMFEKGWSALESAQDFSSLYEQLNELWQGVLEADDHARQAAQAASSGDLSTIGPSTELANQAIGEFEQARSHLQELALANPSIDVSVQETYLDTRIEALGYAVASNEALAVRDTQTAVAQNDAYNAADAEAADLAQQLPADPGQSAVDAMQQLIGDDIESYEAARAQASASDAFLRDYFGSSEK